MDNSSGDKLTYDQAMEQFKNLLENLQASDTIPFLNWVQDSYSDQKPRENSRSLAQSIAFHKLEEIASHLQERLPISTMVNSETLKYPQEGMYDSDCNPGNTVNVDCFIYDEDGVEELVTKGQLSRNYCLDCGSKNTKPLNFISHSLSKEQVEFIFTSLVPLHKQKEDFHIVDIGSRFGSVIAAASVFSDGRARATGIEMNKELCTLQEDIIKQFELKNVSVECCDVRNAASILKTADLVIMNNVFGFFLDPAEQTACWEYIHEHIPPGCKLLHHPEIKTVTQDLQLSFNVKDWLEKVKTKALCARFAGNNDELLDDCVNLALYNVKER